MKLRSHQQLSEANRVHAKLAAHYFGPYPITTRIEAVAYRLQLPAGARIHPVFHISLLKKAIGDYAEESELPELLDGEDLPLVQPVAVLAQRDIPRQSENVLQVLIEWQGKSPEEATWEDLATIRSEFPAFNLEDKVVPLEGNILRAANRVGPLANDHKPKIWQGILEGDKRNL